MRALGRRFWCNVSLSSHRGCVFFFFVPLFVSSGTVLLPSLYFRQKEFGPLGCKALRMYFDQRLKGNKSFAHAVKSKQSPLIGRDALFSSKAFQEGLSKTNRQISIKGGVGARKKKKIQNVRTDFFRQIRKDTLLVIYFFWGGSHVEEAPSGTAQCQR